MPILFTLRTVATALLAFLAVKLAFHVRRKRRALWNVAGPPSHSFLIGNTQDVHSFDAGATTLAWAKKYGGVVRWDGLLKSKKLMVSDPRALKYILGNHASNFERAFYRRQEFTLALGPGLSASAGADHTRQRRVMQPSLNPGPVRALAPVFAATGDKLCKVIAKEPEKSGGSAVIDIHKFVELATLDAMFLAAFGIDMNALESGQATEWGALMSLTLNTSLWPPPPAKAFLRLGLPKLPSWASAIVMKLPIRDIKILGIMRAACKRQSRAIIKERREAIERGEKVGNDALSMMLKANEAENPKHRLSEDELAGQICNLLVAGHQTTAHSICWTVYELARQPEMQKKLREEIRNALAENPDIKNDANALDQLPYLNAVLKESSRYHPAVVSTGREAINDDVLPLSEPVLTRDGKTKVDQIHVPAGTGIELDIYVHNMLPAIWGPDAEVFRPERWLGDEGAQKRGVGLYDGLMNFIIGPRACIGWRFSVVEMQAIIFSLFDKFEFEPAPGVEIGKAFNFFVNSYVIGKADAGSQCPVVVKSI